LIEFIGTPCSGPRRKVGSPRLGEGIKNRERVQDGGGRGTEKTTKRLKGHKGLTETMGHWFTSGAPVLAGGQQQTPREE
jgi:hypothetical protein